MTRVQGAEFHPEAVLDSTHAVLLGWGQESHGSPCGLYPIPKYVASSTV